MKVIYPLQSVTVANYLLTYKLTCLTKWNFKHQQTILSGLITMSSPEMLHTQITGSSHGGHKRHRNPKWKMSLLSSLSRIRARPSCQWSQQTCYIRWQHYRRLAWWEQWPAAVMKTDRLDGEEKGGWMDGWMKGKEARWWFWCTIIFWRYKERVSKEKARQLVRKDGWRDTGGVKEEEREGWGRWLLFCIDLLQSGMAEQVMKCGI